ncbi:MAG: hypothetical protein EHM79_05735 [Geobacter sp.]|nr:MAG: hypothetical protein EHM79_05735 [Geobacter sp.]
MFTFRCLVILLLPVLLAGCAGIAKGVAQAVLEKKETSKADTRQCYVRGRPFEGLETFLGEEENDTSELGAKRPDLKVLMVHGMGSHQPGYSARMAENLARALSLNRVQEQYKELTLSRPHDPERELGNLRISRFLNDDGTRSMIFYELTWYSIIEREKQSLSFDNSEEYAFRRATVNRMLKEFVNDTVPDVLMYNGTSQEKIQSAVAQSLCWMMAREWEDLPGTGADYCDPLRENVHKNLDDRFVFITHSLGSRIVVDTMQYLATLAQSDPRMSACADALKHKKFTVFMLSNQLPLLQLGRPVPEITGQIAAICSPTGPRSAERLLGELKLVAFSDPNDLFSYPLPPRFLDEYLDSRICPTLTNVILNVAPVNDLFGLGDMANPMSAHISYDNDSRVIGLIARGIGSPDTDPKVKECCTWIETVPEKQ